MKYTPTSSLGTMRVGIVGVGRMGGTFARALADHDAIDTLTLAGSAPGRAAALAAAVGADAADSSEEVIARSDAVVIAAASSAHPTLLDLAIDAGRPVFCEKPLALDLETTDRLVAKIVESGATVQVGHHRRFDAGYAALQDRVASGALGRIYLVRSASHDSSPSHDSFIPTSGGIFRDLWVHDMDALRFVTGQEIDEVFVQVAKGPEVYERHDDWGMSAGVVRLSGGSLAIVSGLRDHPAGHDVRLEVHGSAGSAVAGWNPRSPLPTVDPVGLPPPVDPYPSFMDRFAAAYVAEIRAFIDFVDGRIANPCPPADARAAFAAALAAELSAAEHRPVTVSEIG